MLGDAQNKTRLKVPSENPASPEMLTNFDDLLNPKDTSADIYSMQTCVVLLGVSSPVRLICLRLMPPLGDESLPNTSSTVNILGSRNFMYSRLYRNNGISITNDMCEKIWGPQASCSVPATVMTATGRANNLRSRIPVRPVMRIDLMRTIKQTHRCENPCRPYL